MSDGRNAPPPGRVRSMTMVVVLGVLTLLSAVPVASNRPSLWLTSVVVVAALAAAYVAFSLLRDPNRALHVMRYSRLFLMAAIVPAYGLFQSLDVIGFLQPMLFPVRAGMQTMAPQTISFAPDASIMGALRLMGYLIFLALVIEVCHRRETVQMLLRILFFGICLQAAFALFALNSLDDFALWGTKTAYQGMATGTFVNRNSLATYLGFGLVLGFGLIARRHETPKIRLTRPAGPLGRLEFQNVVYGSGMLVIFAALVATQSRMGMLATLCGLTTAASAFRSSIAQDSRRPAVVGALLVVAIGVVVAILGQEGLLTRSLFLSVDGVERWEIYRHVILMIKTRPLTGFGLDAFFPAFETFRTETLTSPNYFDYAHNSYLALWAELGLIVGSIPPFLLAVVAGRTWARLRSGENGAAYFSILLGVLVLGGVHSLVDFSLEIPANNFVFLAILGAVMGIRVRAEAASPAPAPAPADASLPIAKPVPHFRLGG